MNQFFLSELRNGLSKSQAKYSRNLRAYTNTPEGGVILSLRDTPVQGYYQTDMSVEQDTAPTAQMSVIRSCIDTLISKIASTKVRPFFTPVSADWKTVKILKQVQLFFDDLFDKIDAVKKITNAFRDACIFDTGYVFINPFDYSISKLSPWQISLLDTEYHYGKLTKALIHLIDVPKSIAESVYGIKDKGDYINTLEMYFDTEEKKVHLIADGSLVKSYSYTAPLPLVILHYNTPVQGNKTTSVVDDLYNIQWNINLLNARIKEAATLTVSNIIAVDSMSDVTTENMDNRAGQIMHYDSRQGGQPIEVITPAFINQQYQTVLEYYIQKAYEMVGISTLSAQSVNPLGANASGAALQSMENIESTRFETQLNQVVRGYVELAKLLIEVLPEDNDIIPGEISKSGFTWKDVKKQASLLHMQYSAQTMLSKDPSTRLNQIMQLSQIGLIPQGRLGQFLEMPDISEVFNLMTAAQDAVDKSIELALEEEIYMLPQFESYQLLGETITATQNQLFSLFKVGDKEIPEALRRLQNLEELLKKELLDNGAIPIEQGDMQISENGIGGQGAVMAPSTVDAVNMGLPPEAANDKNQWGEV